MTIATPLGTDAHTAFRLVMGEDGRAPVGRMVAAWNAIDRSTAKKTNADLPPDMTRIGAIVVCDTPLDPLHLSFEQVVAEALRLSGAHRPPTADGWHQLSNVARVANLLVGGRDLRTMGAERSSFTDAIGHHPGIETRRGSRTGDLALRAVTPVEPVTTRAHLKGEAAPRTLPDQPGFGAAFRQLLAMPTTLVGDGATVEFGRGDETRQARWSQETGVWTVPDGTRLRRSDASDPVVHAYANGHMVETIIGFVSRSHGGRVFAMVGVPRDSEGDDDALITAYDRKEAASVEEALELLDARDDLDHVLRGVQSHNGVMGFWLRGMKP